jgi:hypothetical protein
VKATQPLDDAGTDKDAGIRDWLFSSGEGILNPSWRLCHGAGSN